jgi:dihydrofolate reductase
MRKLILFMHTSLDGFVAGPKGEMDWIHVDEEMFDYANERIQSADTALYGRVTYAMMEGYWPTAGDKPNASKHDIEHSRWYNKVSKIVLSRSLKENTLKNAKVIASNVADEIQKIKQQSGEDIIIFGSPGASHSLMEKNLIDDYWLFVNPILLGNGIPVFKNIDAHIKLKLKKTDTLQSGVVVLNYETIRN